MTTLRDVFSGGRYAVGLVCDPDREVVDAQTSDARADVLGGDSGCREDAEARCTTAAHRSDRSHGQGAVIVKVSI
jgi:hypothetical protein